MIVHSSHTVTVNTALQEETTRPNTSSHTKASNNTVAVTAVSNNTLRNSPAILKQAVQTTIKATARIPTRHRTANTTKPHTASPLQHTATSPKTPTAPLNPAPKTAALWAP